ncbi:hypothetical protein CN616_22805 [Bacillus toyonensis]|uniref:coiled-coil domain-containing protein n=1 Tax=Bacillus toyonensis TaxID=155322 RepID=UPI000BF04838|nr:hypothetical protein [Bacillus toyonensis]PEM15193.1 hypothetical protein CN616_22805 [Bacillus toyonensis]
MKLTLFTISNEQIKESLDKLQTKVESLETVKELQDKVISMQDHQISFLNDSIANMWQPIAIVSGLAALIITGAFAYVTYLNKQAQEKINQAATIIDQSQSITTVAQEKIDELDEKQKILQKQAKELDKKQKMDMHFNHIKTNLDLIKERSVIDRGICPIEHKDEFDHLLTEMNTLATQYRVLLTDMGNKIIEDINITEDDFKNIKKLKQDVQEFVNSYISLYLKFNQKY